MAGRDDGQPVANDHRNRSQSRAKASARVDRRCRSSRRQIEVKVTPRRFRAPPSPPHLLPVTMSDRIHCRVAALAVYLVLGTAMLVGGTAAVFAAGDDASVQIDPVS